MKILTCYHFPRSEDARIAGMSFYDNPKEIKRLIRYLPENTPSYMDLTIDEAPSFAADSCGLSPVYKRKRIRPVLSNFSLDSVRSRSTETVSK